MEGIRDTSKYDFTSWRNLVRRTNIQQQFARVVVSNRVTKALGRAEGSCWGVIPAVIWAVGATLTNVAKLAPFEESR